MFKKGKPKMSEAQDRKMDKRMGLKEDSKADKAHDRKYGVGENAMAKMKARKKR